MNTLSIVEHDTGFWGVLCHDQQVVRLEFMHPDFQSCRDRLLTKTPLLIKERSRGVLCLDNLEILEPVTAVASISRTINQYLSGKNISLKEVPRYEYSCWTSLKRKVMTVTHKIPYGHAMSYAELAAAAGAPGAARAIGSVMSSNPYPLIVPCHRVLGSGGKLGGYSAPGGLDTKRQLLSMENIYVSLHHQQSRKLVAIS